MLASSETIVRMPDGVALHARPAAMFVQTAMLVACGSDDATTST